MKSKLASIAYIFQIENIFWSVTCCPVINDIALKYQIFIYQVPDPEKKIVCQCEFETGQPTVKNAQLLLEQVLTGKIK